jgi:hypothetical protein
MTNLKLVKSNEPTALDFAVLEAGIGRQTPYETERGKQFVRYIASDYFRLQEAALAKAITDGGGDCGVDIFYIDTESSTVNICNCKCVSSIRKIRHNFPSSELDKISRFLRVLLSCNEERLSSLPTRLANSVQEFWDLAQERQVFIKVHLFSNQMILTRSERERFLGEWNHSSVIELAEHGLYELAHGSVAASRPKFKKKILIEPNNSFQVIENGHIGVQARISLSEIYKFVLEDRTNQFDERLLHHNVRYFLGRDTLVNRAIYNSISSGHTADFWFLNNGITVVCENIISLEGRRNITLINPQIVNGGQTTRAIYNALGEELEKPKDGYVSLKIIETSDKDFIDRIAVASNSQSRIYGRDLRAVDNKQLAMSKALAARGFFYERKRGESQSGTDFPRIGMHEAGQWLMAYCLEEPSRSRSSSEQIFEDLYDLVFTDTSFTPAMIICCHQIWKEIERKLAARERNSDIRTKTERAESWLAHARFHILFCVAQILKKRRIELDSVHDALGCIDTALEAVERFVAKQQGLSAYRLFRASTTKDGLMEELTKLDIATSNSEIQMDFEF